MNGHHRGGRKRVKGKRQMSAKLNGMTETEIHQKQVELYNESKEKRDPALYAESEIFQQMLLAIDDAKFLRMSPEERKQQHKAAGLRLYDDSQYTDAAVIESFTNSQRGELVKAVIFE